MTFSLHAHTRPLPLVGRAIAYGQKKGPHPPVGHLLQQEGRRRDYIKISLYVPTLEEVLMQSLLRALSCVEKVPNGRMRSLFWPYAIALTLWAG